jgi:hypothetical protein
MTDAPNTAWRIVAPGVIELPETRFAIRYNRGLFHVEHNSVVLGACLTLQCAKEHAVCRMRELMEIGIEP